MTKRVLFVSYCFPPMGGVSVQRVTKFVKYLPAFGWDCSVLTVQDPSESLMDDTLLSEISDETIVRRAKTYEPSHQVKALVSKSTAKRSIRDRLLTPVKSVVRGVATTFLQPDAQILWRPHAIKVGRALLQEVQHDVIVATAPPFSSFFVGSSLARTSKLPLVLDYRDEWGISNAVWENRKPNWMVNQLQMAMQRRVLECAEAVTTTTPSSAREIESISRRAGLATCVYNGFDGSSFKSSPRETISGPSQQRFQLTLMGSLWNLVPVNDFVVGMRCFIDRYPELASQLELVFAGQRTSEQEQALDQLAQIFSAVTRYSFMPHEEALALICSSSALLLVLGDLPGAARVIHARTFEYMAARRPMLVVAPQGDLTDLVDKLPGVVVCHPKDAEGIANALANMITQWKAGQLQVPASSDIERFERRSLAGEFASVLDKSIKCRQSVALRGSVYSQQTVRVTP